MSSQPRIEGRLRVFARLVGRSRIDMEELREESAPLKHLFYSALGTADTT